MKKKFENGNVRFKARLVAKGYTQKYGIDYTETLAPVMRTSSIRILLSLALNNDMYVHHIDVKTAYLNSNLNETIYMRQPYMFEAGEDKVCKLNKAIYGLKQSARCWHKRLTNTLKKLNFKHLQSDACIFTNDKRTCVIGFYVDDLIIMSKDEDEIRTIKNRLKSEFDLTDKGRLSTFLGIAIEWQSDLLKLNQTKYIEGLLIEFGMENCGTANLPTPSAFNFEKFDESPELIDRHPYQSLVGSLIYLANDTRPDIQYVTGQLCRFMSCPKKAHFQAAKRVLQYLQKTKHTTLTYHKNPKRPYMEIICDADYAKNEDSKSISGVVTFHRGNAINWCSRVQQNVAASTCEAELLSVKEGIQDAVYYKELLSELTNSYELESVRMYNDNQSAIKTIEGGGRFSANRHYINRINFVRDYIEQGYAVLTHIGTTEMLADGWTKPLGTNKFVNMFRQYGITSDCGGVLT